jgi:hypothetical protein
MTADEITSPDVSIRDLEQRWGLSRNGLKARAKALGVELIRVSSTLTTWPGAFIELGDRLHDHISSGQPMGTFPGLAPVTDRPVPSRQQQSEAITASNETALIAVVEAITASTKAALPAPDPLAVARRLAEAADLGVALTNSEMSQVLGRASISPKQDGWSPRPGFTIHRQEHNGSPFWTVVRAASQTPISVGSPMPADARQVGFNTAASMAVVDVSASDCTGSSLFGMTKL